MSQLTQHTKSLADTEWIPALSPTRWNVQTMTKSFVDKRSPRQNGVPDRHVGNKLSFQVNWRLWINSIALSSSDSDHPSIIQNHWSIRSGFPLSPQRHVFQGVHLQKCSEVLLCFGSDTSNHFQTSPRSSAQWRLLQHYEQNGFPLSPQLDETSKPRQNHLLIKQGLGRTEYLINTWATNWVFKSIKCFESTA